MFVMARDHVHEKTAYEVMGGYFSPVSDQYRKPGLALARHRVRMCELATHWSEWLMVDSWEARSDVLRSALVLDHFDAELNASGGVRLSDGTKKPYRIMLLAGGDLVESFNTPGLWMEDDLHHILGKYGCVVVERTGTDVWGFLLSHDILHQHRANVHVVKQLIHNDISSTKIRLFVKRGMTIKYLLPNSVIHYIKEQRLYV
jgi:nicotinamide mononucleotide adenylyltransferase